MTFTLATRTKALIDQMLEADQGVRYRHFLGRVLPHIGDAYSENNEPFRTHLGASMIGRECAREIWYGWRWATNTQHPGRILRLFNRGHLEEGRFIALFLMIGCQVYQQDEHGKQYRISYAEGHAGGSGDGVAIGLPDLAPGQAALLEFKTHGDKSFTMLTKVGVREAKFEHYVQMQLYMHKMGLAVALYGAVNKNTDELHLELITLDVATAEQFLNRGVQLVWMNTAPKKLSNSPGFYKCKFCDHKGVCHTNQEPARNCRTCAHSKPYPNKVWGCTLNGEPVELSKEQQFAACTQYQRHPEI